ncbi:hypothetical protein LD35_gp44 [Escherichia phage vB_EcoP_PhAPEC7]|uniref:Uncharacterized protein n=1 Tax=Escherichia phage vB_EcoP_PhAPEC7 TaxID=1391223 RepID=A0A067ZGX1_9CAUD|nr:hypothetical protein LD35_gp44 [Escherichia phage vB_EcoP_PhAPEC7]AHV82668.1 hypothetical protein PhAPEC7_43 [Escherichia phage vB_EcoP_PhAPEC7]
MTKSTKETAVKKYHWMVAAQVIFQLPKADDGSLLTMNTMLLTDEPHVTYKDLARVNHSLKISLDQRFDTSVDLKDIVYLSINNLGLMSEPEFQANMIPKGE